MAQRRGVNSQLVGVRLIPAACWFCLIGQQCGWCVFPPSASSSTAWLQHPVPFPRWTPPWRQQKEQLGEPSNDAASVLPSEESRSYFISRGRDKTFPRNQFGSVPFILARCWFGLDLLVRRSCLTNRKETRWRKNWGWNFLKHRLVFQWHEKMSHKS